MMMLREHGFMALFLISTCLTLACCSGVSIAAEAGDSKSVSAPVAWSGAKSRIEEPLCVRITTEREWRALWLRHLGIEAKDYDELHNAPPIPKVDFGTHMIIAVFGGAKDSTQGLRMWSATETTTQFTFRYSVQFYNNIKKDPTTPYGIFVLPLSEKKLAVQVLGPNDSQGDPTWQTAKELPALKPKQ